MKTIIHVNQHVIRENRKTGKRKPPITVKTYKETRYAKEVNICGAVQIRYLPDRPLKCGAEVWIETQGNVFILE